MISNLCDTTLQTDRQTDRQTDGRHAISILRYVLVHRTVKRKYERQESGVIKLDRSVVCE